MNLKASNDGLDLEDIIKQTQGVAYTKETRMTNSYRFWLDEDIGAPAKYREMLNILTDATEDDFIEIMLSTNGGRLDSCINIITAIRGCEGHVHGTILSECHSAGSIIALSCHTVSPTPLCNMMVHQGSGGSFGYLGNVAVESAHVKQRISDLYDEVYEGFFTPEELEVIKIGGDKWIGAEEIEKRLKIRQEYFEAKIEAERVEQERLEAEANKPKRKPRAKKAT